MTKEEIAALQRLTTSLNENGKCMITDRLNTLTCL